MTRRGKQAEKHLKMESSFLTRADVRAIDRFSVIFSYRATRCNRGGPVYKDPMSLFADKDNLKLKHPPCGSHLHLLLPNWVVTVFCLPMPLSVSPPYSSVPRVLAINGRLVWAVWTKSPPSSCSMPSMMPV